MRTWTAILVVALLGVAPGCKKKATYDDCTTKCSTVGKESYDRCLLDNPKAICDSAQESGALSCQRLCATSFGKPVPSASVATAAPSPRNFAGNEPGAKELLAQFVAGGADHPTLSKTLRPTSADYRELFDEETATQIEAAATPQWDSGKMVVAPKPGQTEVKIWSASTEDLRAGTGSAKEFPGGYAKVASRLKPGAVLYRFTFTEPGHDLGMAYDGLAHVNGHWVIVPKPWRMMAATHEAPSDAPNDAPTASSPPPSAPKKAVSKSGSMRSGAVSVNGRLPPEVVQRIVRQRYGTFRQCYEKGLLSNPELMGRVSVKFVIGRNGDVMSAQDGGSDLPSSVVSCIVKGFSDLHFPQPEGGIVTVVYPVKFEPGH